eukprot:scaffold45452_cov229-Amphora_coffeaeformis.AAC.1
MPDATIPCVSFVYIDKYRVDIPRIRIINMVQWWTKLVGRERKYRSDEVAWEYFDGSRPIFLFWSPIPSVSFIPERRGVANTNT